MSTVEKTKLVSNERCLWRGARIFLRVLRGIAVVLFEPPRMVREVGGGRRPEEVSEFKREKRYNCIRWQI